MRYDLNDQNLEILSIKFYNGNSWLKEDFEVDMKRLKYIKRLLGKYVKKNDLKERLILNHIIILGNVFGPDFTSRLLFFYHDEAYYPIIKTFLFFLNYLPEKINSINGKIIDTRLIPLDMKLVDVLRKI